MMKYEKFTLNGIIQIGLICINLNNSFEKEVRHLGIYISKAFVMRQNVVYITDIV